MIKALFSDIDGTVINSSHQMTAGTREALRKYQDSLKMALVSARNPSGIYPLLEKNGLSMTIVCYNGAWIEDENRNRLYECGMERATAKEVLDYLEHEEPEVLWNIYSEDEWIVKDNSDPRIKREERIVEDYTVNGSLESVRSDAKVHKILCICPPDRTAEIETRMKKVFPDLTMAQSADHLIEIMAEGINKAKAVRFLCDYWDISPDEAVAFGDNYNDLEMLGAVSFGVAMGNAPEEIRSLVPYQTKDNDHDGIAFMLKQLVG